MSHAGSAKEVAEGEEIHVLLDSKSAVDCRAEFRMLFSIPKRGVPCVAAFVCSMLTCCVFFPGDQSKTVGMFGPKMGPVEKEASDNIWFQDQV